MEEDTQLTVAFLVFDGMQLLDFANPWEVFSMWNRVRKNSRGTQFNQIKFSIESYNAVRTSGKI